MAVGLFFLAYGVMLPIVALHVLVNWKVFRMEGYTSLAQLKACGPRVEAYKRTMPFQPLYNVLVFGVLSACYLTSRSFAQLLGIGLTWLAMGIVVDALTWVLLPHPWRLSFKELYLGHQPWLSLCYVCIVFSPLIALFF